MSKKAKLTHVLRTGPDGAGLILDNNIAQLALSELNRISVDFVLLIKIVNEGSALDDRSFAIVLTAFVDGLLSVALQKTFAEMVSKISKDLFEQEGGPLSTLHKKALVAFALGLIDDDLLETIGSLKRIRNVFAHSLANIDFNHPAISDVCKTLRADHLDEQTERRLLQIGHDKSTNRGRFFFGCRNVFGHLLSYMAAFGDSYGGPTRFPAKRFHRDELGGVSVAGKPDF